MSHYDKICANILAQSEDKSRMWIKRKRGKNICTLIKTAFSKPWALAAGSVSALVTIICGIISAFQHNWERITQILTWAIPLGVFVLFAIWRLSVAHYIIKADNKDKEIEKKELEIKSLKNEIESINKKIGDINTLSKIPSRLEAIRDSELVLGFWHSGELAKEHFKYGKVKKVLLLEPKADSEAFLHVIRESGKDKDYR
jgi:hypothetical protein